MMALLVVGVLGHLDELSHGSGSQTPGCKKRSLPIIFGTYIIGKIDDGLLPCY